ncbi:MAG: hypothetical protein DRQ48_05650 [Gammaproteobacteria bacterium]|nr:MAG: hypothetical protein DRQ58_05825 [Gammaproteobacteria bacterium]RKZ70754.1 MAG: hypothetical protein DRQ48_05650 [Gammaproteobacteria bacterium]
MEHNLMRSSRQHLLVTFALAIPVLLAVIAIGIVLGTDMHALTTDGSFISDLGALLWCVAATVCFYTALILRNHQTKEVRQFLLYSATLTCYLLFDDFFRIHELYFPKYFDMDEKVIYLVLAIAAISLVIKCWRTILETNYIVMLVGLGLLAISIISDGMIKPIETVYGILVMMFALSFTLFISKRSLFKEFVLVIAIVVALCVIYIVLDSKFVFSEDVFEEGAKWLGISCWCSYNLHTAYQYAVNGYTDKNING